MNKQTIFKIVGALFLGALGNGVWEVIKPAFTFAGLTTLSIISLGFDSVINEIFLRVGRANVSVLMISATTLLLIGVGTMVFILATRAPAEKSSFVRLRPWASLLLLLSVGATQFGAYRHLYVVHERGYFDNLVRASAPYLTPEQRLSIDSRLVLVKTKADYEKLVNELKQNLRAHDLEYEKF